MKRPKTANVKWDFKIRINWNHLQHKHEQEIYLLATTEGKQSLPSTAKFMSGTHMLRLGETNIFPWNWEVTKVAILHENKYVIFKVFHLKSKSKISVIKIQLGLEKN